MPAEAAPHKMRGKTEISGFIKGGTPAIKDKTNEQTPSAVPPKNAVFFGLNIEREKASGSEIIAGVIGINSLKTNVSISKVTNKSATLMPKKAIVLEVKRIKYSPIGFAMIAVAIFSARKIFIKIFIEIFYKSHVESAKPYPQDFLIFNAVIYFSPFFNKKQIKNNLKRALLFLNIDFLVLCGFSKTTRNNFFCGGVICSDSKTHLSKIFSRRIFMNCFGFLNDNCNLWLLIILLIICCGGCGCVNKIIDKICGCGCLLPILLVLLCCCDKGGCGREPKPPFPGCGCK